jgi:hypothetical protein
MIYFYEPVTPQPVDCSAPYTYTLLSGTGTLYPSGKYVPNQYQAEEAEIQIVSSDNCKASFKISTL